MGFHDTMLSLRTKKDLFGLGNNLYLIKPMYMFTLESYDFGIVDG